MPLRDNLLREIQQSLGPAVTPSLNSASAASDLYEAYLFCLVLEAAAAEDAESITLKCIHGGHPDPFIFRTSPGHLNSQHRNYGYAEIVFPNCNPVEVHVGVRVSGHSGVLHECDVSVIRKEEAELCRNSSDTLAPRSSKVLIAVEAKYYTVELALHLGRSFLGLVTDLSADTTFFVMNREAPSIAKLLAHKKRHWDHQIEPSRARDVERLRNMFQTAFKNYKARSR
jgi:hypothetical protein